MEGSALGGVRRGSTRTLAVAVLGFGAAALVTSASALSLEASGQTVLNALWGGTGVLAVAAAITLFCAAFHRAWPQRLLWGGAGLSLALTAAGAGMRSLTMVSGVEYAGLASAEIVYAVGAWLMGCVLVAFPFARNNRGAFMGPVIETLTLGVIGAGAFWVSIGQNLVASAYRSGAIGPLRMQQFLLFLLGLAGATMFSAACQVHAQGHADFLEWSLLIAAMVGLLYSDVVWLWKIVEPGWAPGSLTDFIHISVHVMVAIAASLALDHRSLEASRRG